MGPYALPYKLTTYEIVFYLNLILQGANKKRTHSDVPKLEIWNCACGLTAANRVQPNCTWFFFEGALLDMKQ